MDKQTNNEPPLSFPKTLEGFGYAFNEQGQMRHVETGEAFVFKVREDDRNWNQKRYEALGEVLNQHVFELLEKKCNMTRVMVPVDATENEPSSFIFLSPDALTNPSKLLVLIQGSGVVRAGQWARRLIINEDLDSGTQIPFIARAMEEGYGVMVLNPNENSVEVDMPTPSSLLPLSQSEPSDGQAEKDMPTPSSLLPLSQSEPLDGQAEKDMPTPSSLLPLSQSEPLDGQAEKDMPTPSSLLPLSQSEPSDGQAEKRDKAFDKQHCNSDKERETKQIQIRENSSSQEHVLYVWDHFVSRAQAKDVFIVAHSYGGLSLVDLMKRREAELKSRVVAVAFTDSVHNIRLQKPNQGVQNWMQKHCRNWVRSEEPLDTRMRTNWPDCPCVSAGTDEHELTSWRSFQSIFRFFNKAPRKEDRRR